MLLTVQVYVGKSYILRDIACLKGTRKWHKECTETDRCWVCEDTFQESVWKVIEQFRGRESKEILGLRHQGQIVLTGVGRESYDVPSP